MFRYGVSADYSVEDYKNACKFIEDLFGNTLTKMKEWVDFDDSHYQDYITPKGKVTVINDWVFETVDVFSEFEIDIPEWFLYKNSDKNVDELAEYKMIKKGLTKDEAYLDILSNATKINDKY